MRFPCFFFQLDVCSDRVLFFLWQRVLLPPERPDRLRGGGRDGLPLGQEDASHIGYVKKR